MSEAKEHNARPPLAVVRAPERPARDDLECFLIGWQIRKTEWFGGAAANTLFRELRTGFSFSDPLLDACQRAIDAAVDGGQPVTPQHLAARIAVDSGEDEGQLFNFLRNHSLGAPAAASEADLRQQMAGTLNLLRDAGKADRRKQAHELLLANGIDALDDVRALLEGATAAAPTGALQITPFVWVKPESIPPRRFLFKSRHAIAGYVSLTGAPGGTGKSSLLMVESLAHCTGRDLLNDAPLFQGRSWMLGLEDNHDEHTRRAAAAGLLHGIGEAQTQGRFFLDTSEQNFVVARRTKDELLVVEPVLKGMIERIRDEKITHVTVDPFIASHAVPENDNGAIDTVARLYGRIARETGCAIELCHHLRKSNGNEPTVDDFRGGSALVPAVRAARLLATMAKEDAQKYGIEEYSRFFSVIDVKRNMAARSVQKTWRELVTLDLRNGPPSDHVAVVQAWAPPDAQDGLPSRTLLAVQKMIAGGEWREAIQSPLWAGNAIAEVLGIDPSEKQNRSKCLCLLKSWMKGGALKVVIKPDSARREKAFIEVGHWDDSDV